MTAPSQRITPDGHSSLAAPEAVLFAFDDQAIPFTRNLKLTLEPARRHPGNPLLRRGAPGEPDAHWAAFYGTVLRVDGKFRMWYTASPSIDAVRQLVQFVGYAESDDGLHWIKPTLGRVDYNGSRENNLVRLPENADWAEFPSVIYEPKDPDPDHRYKMVYINHHPSTYSVAPRFYSSRAAVWSGDGLRWSMAETPVPGRRQAFEVTGLYHFNGLYYSTGQQHEPFAWLPTGQAGGRVMSCFWSPDFVHWSDERALSFHRSQPDAELWQTGEQVHAGAGIWNRGNVLIGLYGQWRGAAKRQDVYIDLGLLVSSDGIRFREPVPGFKVLAHGEPGAWDGGCLLQGHGFVNVGDETWIYYGGWDTGVVNEAQSEIGLMTLRRDGFGYLSHQDHAAEASLGTCPIDLGKQSAHLALNVAGVTPHTPLTVELLDTRGNPVPGYTADECQPIRESGVHVGVTWQRHATIHPSGSPFRLRLRLPPGGEPGGPRLYALYLEPGGGV